jgi:hypothetical protein
MTSAGILAIALTFAAPDPRAMHPTAAAGIAAYERGDFEQAFSILRPFVFDLPPDLNLQSPPEPFATFYLARMFLRGEGTNVDSAMACVLYNFATMGLIQRIGRDHLTTKTAMEESKSACDASTLGNREELDGLLGCPFRDGVTHTVINLAGGGSVVVDRGGFHVSANGETVRTSPRATCGKHEVTVSVSGTRLQAASGAGPRTRDFVEMFVWVSASADGHVRRELQWRIFEIVRTKAVLRLAQPMLYVFDTPYPSTEMPDGIRDAAILRVNDLGAVEFTVKGAGSGVIK